MRSANTRAYVTILLLNDSYLPGALLQAYSLGQQDEGTDRICLITEDISKNARRALRLLFDYVIPVDELYVSRSSEDRRRDLPWLLTRMNALRLGPDGDLGFAYKKIVLLDADILPLKHYRHLFLLDPPAGIINERKDYFLPSDISGKHSVPDCVEIHARWVWHEIYRNVKHGDPIPRALTDKVKKDRDNMGVNTALLVLEPSIPEYVSIIEELSDSDVARLVGDRFRWPDMQYLTMKWSGRWTNIDVCFCGINGYPSLACLFGVHYAGIKPWDTHRWKSVTHYSRFEDFRYWHGEYLRMVRDVPELLQCGRLARLKKKIEELEVPVAV
jgi:glycogenin glucosyltransferase